MLEHAFVLGPSEAMRTLSAQIDEAVHSTLCVLITGPTGAGKEEVAREIHQRSKCRGQLVVADCPSIPPHLLGASLHGHVRGAFTGAETEWDGYVAEADGGTLLLDEIGHVPLDAQAHLLRIAATGTRTPLGSTRAQRCHARIVAATNVDLEAAVHARTFRSDLFYRIAQIVLRVPPLDAHTEDIPAIVEAVSPVGWTESALKMLMCHRWPGNIRQLRAVIKRVSDRGEVVTADTLADVLPRIQSESLDNIVETAFSAADGVDGFLRRLQTAIHDRALREASGNLSRAASRLGVNRRTLSAKVLKARDVGAHPDRRKA